MYTNDLLKTSPAPLRLRRRNKNLRDIAFAAQCRSIILDESVPFTLLSNRIYTSAAKRKKTNPQERFCRCRQRVIIAIRLHDISNTKY